VSQNSIKQQNERLMRLATYASVLAAVVIIILKMIAWILTDSLSLLSSLVDSVLDVLSSLVNVIALHYALKPADDDHRFGHGKAEDIAAFAQSAFISGSAIFIIMEAIARFADPHPVQKPMIGIVVMIISSVIILLLLAFQRYVIRRTQSSLVKADALHYANDILISLAVIGSFLFVNLQLQWVDAVVALLIAVSIFYGAWRVGRHSFDCLMDKELPENVRKKIVETALLHPKVQGVHDVRTRKSGNRIFMQLHIELPGNLPLFETHSISESVEEALALAFPGAEIIIHQDPEGVEEKVFSADSLALS
jgi:ferrous-iron efflux pump FieF